MDFYEVWEALPEKEHTRKGFACLIIRYRICEHLVSNYPAFGLDYFYRASRSEGIQAFTTQNAQKM